MITVADRLGTGLAERYTVIRELGHGGMAEVYLADDRKHPRQVAIKVLRPELAAAVGAERFLREIEVAARLQHPNVLPLYDSGTVDGLLYYVMPYVSGESLRERIGREKQLPLEDALQIAREVAEALGYAHAHNVVHRDIKPGNILLSGGHALVADFGIARAITAAGGDQLTEAGLAIGTPEYMSPEQGTGEPDIDGRSDVYSLGCVLFEMLVGEPPFQGRTAQAILARHRQEPVPSALVVRPDLPPPVVAAIRRALAKVPADRFATAAAFARALSPAAIQRTAQQVGRRRVAIGSVALLGVGGLLALTWWYLVRPPPRPLDPNRVVVFPPRDASAGAGLSSEGEDVATLIGAALDGTDPLRIMEGSEWLSEADRADMGRFTLRKAAAISRAHGARYFIIGSIIRAPDSTTIVLKLQDVLGDSLMRQQAASAPRDGTPLPQLGVRAVSSFLPALLEGRRVEVSALSQRPLTAIAHFLQGERAYRHTDFAGALDQYQSALEADSSFALAALKAAQAANWQERSGEAVQYSRIANRLRGTLSQRQMLLLQAVQDYLAGSADSALSSLQRAVELDPDWTEAWTLRGEVYYHLLPREGPPDSLAEAAFSRAYLTDSTFGPAAYHLAEILLRKGDLKRAEELRQTIGRISPPGPLQTQLRLMFDCVQQGPATIDWQAAIGRSGFVVYAVAYQVAREAAVPACAESAFTALLRSDSSAYHWPALLGLQSVLIAQGRTNEVATLLRNQVANGMPIDLLYLIDAAAGAGFEAEASATAQDMGEDLGKLSTIRLAVLGAWAAHAKDLTRLKAIVAAFRARAARSGSREDLLQTGILTAHLTLLAGDSASALAQFQRLAPTAPGDDLVWQPWETLGGERLTEANLLLARGEADQAIDVAAEIDSPAPVAYLLYLRPSLTLRAKAAEAKGQRNLADRYRARLRVLDRYSDSSKAVNSTP